MRASRLAILVAALSLAAPSAAQAAAHMQAGLWEVTATVELPGAAAPAPTTQTECLSQKDVEADPVPEIDKAACKATGVRRSGDKITWKLDCGQLGKGQGEIVYRGSTAYDGWMTLETSGTVVRTTLRARRVGGC